MVKIAVNLDDIKGGFTILDAGKYVARLIDVQEKESSTGNPMLCWFWEIDDVEVRSFTSLQDHALFGLKEHLEAFGITGEVDIDTDICIGKSAQLVLTRVKKRSTRTGEEIEVNQVESVKALKSNGPAASGPKGSVVPAASKKSAAPKKGKSLPL
jgi:hypothetical protein